MPFVAAAWVGITAAAGASGLTFGAFLTTTLTGKLLTSVAISALQAALAGKPETQQSGIRTQQTLTGGITPASFILGLYATEGQLAAPAMSHGTSGGTPNAYLTYVIELGDVPGQSLMGLIMDGEAVELGDTDHADYGTPLEGRFTGHAWVKYYDGTQTVADPMLLAKYSDYPDRPWTPEMVGQGLNYAILTFKYNREIFGSFPGVRFIMGGIPLYDPRKDTTVGGLGTHRWDDRSTWETTENAAIHTYNIMRGIEFGGGNSWGGNADAEDLPLAVWWAAMNKADIAIDLGDGTTEPQYRAGYEVFSSDEPAAVIEDLLRGCSGRLAENGGVWKIRLGTPDLPVYIITDDDVILTESEVSSPFSSSEQTFNAVHATHPDPASLWEPRDAPARYNADYEAADGGQRNVADLTLNATPYPNQVQRVMHSYLEDERRFRQDTLTLPPDAIPLEPLDTVSRTSERHHFVEKLFEIQSTNDPLFTGTPRLTLRETDPQDGIWLPQYTLPVVTPSAVITRPIPQTVNGFAFTKWAVQDAGNTDVRPALRIQFDGNQPDVLGLVWEVRIQNTTQVIRNTLQDVSAGELIISDAVQPDTIYEGRSKFLARRPTAWTDWQTVTTDDLRPSLAHLADDVSGAITSAQSTADAAGTDATQALADALDVQNNLTDEVAGLGVDYAAATQAAIDAGGFATVAQTQAGLASQSAAVASRFAGGVVTENMLINGNGQFGTDYWSLTSGGKNLTAQTGISATEHPFTTSIRAENTGTATDLHGNMDLTLPEPVYGNFGDRTFRLQAWVRTSVPNLAVQFGAVISKSDGSYNFPNKYAAPSANSDQWQFYSFDRVMVENAVSLDVIFCRVYSRDGFTDWTEITGLEVIDVTDALAVQDDIVAAVTTEETARVLADQALANFINVVDADVNGLTATVTQQGTALSTLDGVAQAMTGLTAVTTTAGGVTQISGIKATSYQNPDGTGGSLLELIGDNVVAKGTLSADRLTIGLGGNLIENSRFLAGLKSIGYGGPGAVDDNTIVGLRAAGETWSGKTYPVLQMFQDSADTAGYTDVGFLTLREDGTYDNRQFEAEVDTWYEFSVQLSFHRCIGDIYIFWRDADGGYLTNTSLSVSGGTSSTTNPEDWPRFMVKGQRPANAAYGQAIIRKRGTTSGANSSLLIHKPNVSLSHEFATVPAPWTPSGVTLVTGDGIVTNSIEARHLKAGSITTAALDVDNITITKNMIDNNATSKRYFSTDGSGSVATSGATQVAYFSPYNPILGAPALGFIDYVLANPADASDGIQNPVSLIISGTLRAHPVPTNGTIKLTLQGTEGGIAPWVDIGVIGELPHYASDDLFRQFSFVWVDDTESIDPLVLSFARVVAEQLDGTASATTLSQVNVRLEQLNGGVGG